MRHGDAPKGQDGERHLSIEHRALLEAGEVDVGMKGENKFILHSHTVRTFETAEALAKGLALKDGSSLNIGRTAFLGSDETLAKMESFEGFEEIYKRYYKPGESFEKYLKALEYYPALKAYYEELVDTAGEIIQETVDSSIIDAGIIFVFHSTLIEGVIWKITGSIVKCLPGMGHYSIDTNTKKLI